MGVLERFADVYRSRGLGGFARFIATRIAQRREDLLFEIDLRLPPPGPADRLADCVVIDRRNVGRAEVADVERQIFVNENGAYRAGLSGDDLLFASPDRGRVLCYAFVLFHTPYKRVLGRPIEVPMIGNCYTEPDARGRGLYTRMLRTVCDELAARGHPKAIISCAPDNIASIRGIERAGFARVHHVKTLILLSRLIAKRREEPF